MIRKLTANSSVSLSAFAFNGSVDFSFFGKQTFSANDLVFVYTAVKDFGTTVYAPVDFSAAARNVIAGYQSKLQGADLHSAIAGALGTHYVRGYDRAAMVAIVYTFHYASASTRQQMIASASGSYDEVSFSQFVSQFFASTNVTSTMSYEFFSTDPYTNFNFGTSGIIQSYAQFTNFISRVEGYAGALPAANARIVQYVLDPIQTVPGYLGLLGGYVPSPIAPADYDGFLRAYSALWAVKQRLDGMVLGSMLNWLNRSGRQVVLQQWSTTASLVASMKTIAMNHFSTGAPLAVPSEVTAFLSGLNEFRLPEIVFMDSFTAGSEHCLIGRVDCGCSEFTAPRPFYNLAAMYYQTNYYSNGDPSLVPLYYDPMDFQTNQLAQNSGTIRTHLTTLFTGELWNCLTNANPNVNGYFLITQPSNEAANWSVEVDALTPGGASMPVDQIGFLSPVTATVGCSLPCQVFTPLGQ
jgi:hypothetical protein